MQQTNSHQKQGRDWIDNGFFATEIKMQLQILHTKKGINKKIESARLIRCDIFIPACGINLLSFYWTSLNTVLLFPQRAPFCPGTTPGCSWKGQPLCHSGVSLPCIKWLDLLHLHPPLFFCCRSMLRSLKLGYACVGLWAHEINCFHCFITMQMWCVLKQDLTALDLFMSLFSLPDTDTSTFG